MYIYIYLYCQKTLLINCKNNIYFQSKDKKTFLFCKKYKCMYRYIHRYIHTCFSHLLSGHMAKYGPLEFRHSQWSNIGSPIIIYMTFILPRTSSQITSQISYFTGYIFLVIFLIKIIYLNQFIFL